MMERDGQMDYFLLNTTRDNVRHWLGQALAGVGTLAAEDLRTGRLIRPFNVTQTLDFAYYLVCPRRKTSLAKVVAFLRWLRAQTGNDATLVDASLTSSSL